MADTETPETLEETPTTEIPQPREAVEETVPQDEGGETEATTGEQPATTETTQPATRPGWDKRIAKINEENARLRKEKDELNAKLIATLEQRAAARVQTETPAEPAKDDVDSLYEQARKAADTNDETYDPAKAQALLVEAARKRDIETRSVLERQSKVLSAVESQRKQDAAEAQKRAAVEERWNADGVDKQDGDALIQKAWNYAASRKLTGDAAALAANTFYDLNYPSLKDSKKGSRQAAQPATRQAAPAPSAPMDAQIDTGAELSPQERAKAAKSLGAQLRGAL